MVVYIWVFVNETKSKRVEEKCILVVIRIIFIWRKNWKMKNKNKKPSKSVTACRTDVQRESNPKITFQPHVIFQTKVVVVRLLRSSFLCNICSRCSGASSVHDDEHVLNFFWFFFSLYFHNFSRRRVNGRWLNHFHRTVEGGTPTVGDSSVWYLEPTSLML